MNRITIMLEKVPTAIRCEEIAHILCMEHFGTDPLTWDIVDEVPADTPLHLKDQFQAEIRGRSIAEPRFMIIHGRENN